MTEWQEVFNLLTKKKIEVSQCSIFSNLTQNPISKVTDFINGGKTLSQESFTQVASKCSEIAEELPLAQEKHLSFFDEPHRMKDVLRKLPTVPNKDLINFIFNARFASCIS